MLKGALEGVSDSVGGRGALAADGVYAVVRPCREVGLREHLNIPLYFASFATLHSSAHACLPHIQLGELALGT